MKKMKKFLSTLIAVQFLITTAFFNIPLSAKAAVTDTVNIKVSDSTGLKTNFNYSKATPNYISNNDIVLKGDSYASFSMETSDYNTMQYKIVRSITEDPLLSSEEGWKDINLNEQKTNNDIMMDKPGFLKHKAYDVNHLPAITNESDWNNKNLVYKNPYNGSSIISASIASYTAKDYGKMESYLEGKDKKTRFVNNKIFINDTTPGKKIYYTDNAYDIISSWQTSYSKSEGRAYLDSNATVVYYTDADKKNLSKDNKKTKYFTIHGEYKEASKIWGYLKIDETGKYDFKTISDDGLYAYIIVNGEKKVLNSNFRVQGATSIETKGINLEKDNFYPIYMEYFNWGGDAAFQLQFKNDKNGTYKNYIQIPEKNFYPSKSDAPGEYADSVFTGTDGVKLPTESGRYYIAYRAVNKDKNGKINAKGDVKGTLGPYLVETRAKFNISREVINLDGSKVNSQNNVYQLDSNNKTFKVKYKINPGNISVGELFADIKIDSDLNSIPSTYDMKVTNSQINVTLPDGLSYVDTSEEGYVIDGKKSYKDVGITTIKYELDKANKVYKPTTSTKEITFIQTLKANNFGSYTLGEDYSKFIYTDVDSASREMKFNSIMVNIGGVTNIVGNGLFNVKDNTFQDISDKTTVRTMFPSNFAVKVEVNSLNPFINIKTNAMNNQKFYLTKYEINSNEKLNLSSKQTKFITLDKDSSFTIEQDKNFTLGQGKTYLIVYQLRPVKNSKELVINVLDEIGEVRANNKIGTNSPPILK